MKKLGTLVKLAVVAGAVAAGVTYVKQYIAFNKDLDREFHEVEGAKAGAAKKKKNSRKYISLESNTEHFVSAAKETASAAKGMAGAAKDMILDLGNR